MDLSRRCPGAHTRRRLLRAIVVAATAAAVLPVGSAAAGPGSPWFEPSKVYASNFPDPSVIVDNGTYYAYATTSGGAYLPAMSSTDQQTWTARPKYSPNPYNGDPYFNDALPEAPSWALPLELGHDHLEAEIQAPGVAKIAGSFVAFSTVRVAPTSAPVRYCIGVSKASSPLGPFQNHGSQPIQCDSDPVGSIDPDPFIDANGTPYLIWKSEGVPGSTPTKIWSRRLRSDGLAFASGSTPTPILQTARSWEGNVVENPSMVHYAGRYILFYSGNEWRSSNYRTGYAFCAGPAGPCSRPTSSPLLGNTSQWLGPGGADAFIDADGRLRLAYHAWNAPHTDYPQGQRYLRFATLHIDGTCRLVFGDGPTPDGGRRFYVSNRLTGGCADAVFTYGRAGDEVYVGDWDGDGLDTFAVRREKTFYVSNSLRSGNADAEFSYGRLGDEVLVGDWNANGGDTFAVRRGNTFYVSNSLRSGNADAEFSYGRLGDEVLVGDWNANGGDTFAVRRGKTFYVSNSLRSGNADAEFSYGRLGDVVLVGDWNANGGDTFAVRRGNEYFLNNTLAGGNADVVFSYGRSSDEVFVGDWNGDRIDTFALRR